MSCALIKWLSQSFYWIWFGEMVSAGGDFGILKKWLSQSFFWMCFGEMVSAGGGFGTPFRSLNLKKSTRTSDY